MKINLLRIITAILLFICVPCLAQSPDEIERKMDEIKLDESFVYGEDYNKNKDMAYQNALSELLSSINELRFERKLVLISTSDLQPVIKELRYSKGSKNLSFLYLTLSQALSLMPKAKLDNVTNNGMAQNTKPQNVATKKHEEKSQSTIAPNRPSTATVSTPATPVYNDILETLCGQDNWTEIKGFLTSFKNEGKIKETGNCLSSSEVPDDAYSILMDEMGGILSIMSPKNSPNRINHKTNQPDNEVNHANCKFIVWYK